MGLVGLFRRRELPVFSSRDNVNETLEVSPRTSGINVGPYFTKCSLGSPWLPYNHQIIADPQKNTVQQCLLHQFAVILIISLIHHVPFQSANELLWTSSSTWARCPRPLAGPLRWPRAVEKGRRAMAWRCGAQDDPKKPMNPHAATLLVHSDVGVGVSKLPNF